MLEINRVQTGIIPLDLDTAKLFLRVDGDGDNQLITAMILQTLDIIENYLNSSIIEATVEVLASKRKEMFLPFGPVIDITSVQDTDGNDIEYTYDGLTLTLDNDYTTFTVIYNAGFSVLPDGLFLAWQETLAYLYENRGDDTAIQMLLTANNNLQPYRRKVWI